jgi:hypothetical protein
MEFSAVSNLGRVDRIARFAIGLALITAPLALANSIGAVLTAAGIVVGAVLTGTALIGFCPIYALFRLSSKRSGAYRGEL